MLLSVSLIQKASPFQGCDFYSLTNYSDHAITPPTLAPDGWIAWQYHNGSSPEPCKSERGVVLAFRRAANGSQAAVPRSFALRGLSPSRRYALTPWDDAVLAPRTVSGAQLLQGLSLSLPPKSSAVVPYRCVASTVKTDDGQGADGSHLKYLSFCKIVLLSRFVALSVSLIVKASLLQTAWATTTSLRWRSSRLTAAPSPTS